MTDIKCFDDCCRSNKENQCTLSSIVLEVDMSRAKKESGVNKCNTYEYERKK